ncbi:hypothetical protein MKZ38_000666 [Zalerion maritima]|uniref:Uncharacterized protein n=1 Tax=Zalerion maritima TaxID=339359 RepID=A0AAD5RR63_9PEZI|nr:hypothetical protein MKZ38_000666 [Zalerion maritima]
MSPPDFLFNFFSGNFSFEIEHACKKVNKSIYGACEINFFDNDTVESYGDVRRGEFGARRDIAGLGVLLGLAIPGFLVVLISWAFMAKEVAERTKVSSSQTPRFNPGRYAQPSTTGTIVQKLHVFTDAPEDRPRSIKLLYSVLKGLLIYTADAQTIVALSYGIAFGVTSKCDLSAYHYIVGVNVILLACTSITLCTLMHRGYWKDSPVAAIPRTAAALVIFGFMGRMLAYQYKRESSPEDMIFYRHGSNDSALFVPMSCFLDPDLDPLRNLTDGQLDRVGGARGGKKRPTSEMVMYILVALCFVAAHVAHVAHIFRPARQKGRPRKPYSAGFGNLVVFYWVTTLLLCMVTYIWCSSHIMVLRDWVHDSGWMELVDGKNPELNFRSLSQIMPLVTIFWILILVLDSINVGSKGRYQSLKNDGSV